MDTDLDLGGPAPDSITAIDVTTTFGTGLMRSMRTDRLRRDVRLPQSFAITSPAAGQERIVDIRIEALHDGSTITSTRATVNLPAEGTREVVMFLARHCISVGPLCAAAQTCTLRGCEDPSQAVATDVARPTDLDARPWYDATCTTPRGGSCTATDATADSAATDGGASESGADGAQDSGATDSGAMDSGPADAREAGTDASDATVMDARSDASDATMLDARSDASDASCNADAMDCSGTIRAIAPLSTGVVNTRRPTFQWTAASNVAPYTVQLCADRICSMVRYSFATPPTSGPSMVQATMDVPRGTYFWRVAGRRPDNSVAVSPPWLLTVNPGPATETTVSSFHYDGNADGFADAVFGAPGSAAAGATNPAKAFVHLGSSLGLAGMAAVSVNDGMGTNFGASVSSAGDFNGDGYGDLIIGAPQSTTGGPGRAMLYLGGPTGPGPTRVIPAPSEGGQFGASVAGVGDVDGDGYGDVIVSATGAMGGRGRLHLYRGNAMGTINAPQSLSGEAGMNFGVSVAGIGDVNGDGRADFAVGANEASMFSGRVYVYLGTDTGAPTAAHATLVMVGSRQLGSSVAGAGDFNGDGLSDLIVGEHEGGTNPSYPGRAHVFFGMANPVGIARTPSVTLSGTDNGSRFGLSVAGGGDVNGDGLSDVVVGAYLAASMTGTMSLFLGSAGAAPTTPALVITGTMSVNFGRTAAMLGDTNGDGFCEIAGANATGPGGGYVLVYNGGSPLPAASTTIPITASSAAFAFGASIASVWPAPARLPRWLLEG